MAPISPAGFAASLILSAMLLVPRECLAGEPSPAGNAKSTSTAGQWSLLLAEDQRLLAQQQKLIVAGQLAEAIEIVEQRLKLRRECDAKLPDEKRKLATTSLSLIIDKALLHFQQRDDAAAISAAEQAVAFGARTLGENDWATRSAHQFLLTSRKVATLDQAKRKRLRDLESQSQRATAERRFLDAVELLTQLKQVELDSFGADDPWYANSLISLAKCREQLFEAERAADDWQQALAVRKRIYGAAHPDVIACYDGLAALERRRFRIQPASDYYRQAAPARRTLFDTLAPEDKKVWLDDFASDTRRQYQTKGEVDWRSGALEVHPHASIQHSLPAMTWWKLGLQIRWPELVQPTDAVELHLEIAFQDSTLRHLLVFRRWSEGKTSKAQLQLQRVDPAQTGLAGLWSGKIKPQITIVATVDLPAALERDQAWSVNYTAGLLKVVLDGQNRLTAFDEAMRVGTAWTLTAVKGTPALVFCESVGDLDPDLTAEERRKILTANVERQGLVAFVVRNEIGKARAAAQKNLAFFQRTLGNEHPLTVSCLEALSLMDQAEGAYAEAEHLIDQAVRSCERLYGRDHPALAELLQNQANLYRMQAKFAAAEPLYRRSLSIREAMFGPMHPLVADTLNDLAGLHTLQSNYAGAEQLYQRALAIGEKNPNWKLSLTLENLAELNRLQAKYAAAEPLLLRSLKIREASFGPDHAVTATVLNELAELYEAQGNHPAAEPLLRRALAIREKSLGPEHRITAETLNSLGVLYRTLGRYAAAEPVLLRALAIDEKVFGHDDLQTANTLDNLAGLYQSEGRPSEAEPLFKRALAIREKTYGHEHLVTARSLNNLAYFYLSQKKFADAKPLFEQALTITRNGFGPDHPEVATIVANLGSLAWATGDLQNARVYAAQSLDARMATLERAAAIQTEQQQFMMAANAAGNLNFWLSVTADESAAAESAWRPVLAWKGAIASRQLGLRQLLKDDPTYAEFRQVSQQLSTLALNPPLPPTDAKLLAAWSVQAPGLRRAWLAQKIELTDKHQHLEKELAHKSAAFREEHHRRRVTPADIQASLRGLPAATAMVDLLEYGYIGPENVGDVRERRMAAFVVRPDRSIRRIELGPVQPIHAALFEWRACYGKASSERDPGRTLRRLVWEPLESHLDGIHTVLISPDGVLAELPWGALPGAKPDTFLLEQRWIAVIPVPQMLPELIRGEVSRGLPASLFLVGDIDYGGDPGTPLDLLAKREAAGRQRGGRLSFDPLPSAQAELASIERRYRRKQAAGNRATTLDQSDATEAAFRESAPLHPWIHLITHGFLAPAGFGSRLADSALQSASKTSRPATGNVAAGGGVGVRIELERGQFFITYIMPTGAAAKDGRLQVGDEVLAIAQATSEWSPVAGKQHSAVIAAFRGPVGSTLRIKVRRPDQPSRAIELALTRGPLAGQRQDGPVTVIPGLLSGLAFAGANSPAQANKDDGILTALEVSALDLSRVDSVVLSACETGLGQVVSGEGLLGLQRSFQVAGAKTVVASLWKVPDAATSRLMQRFYENLWEKKLGKLAALRDAQIWMLHDQGNRGLVLAADQSPGAELLPPFYWAAFVLSGDWR